MTLQAIGDELNISRERVRQLEKKVLCRLRGKKNRQTINGELKVNIDGLLNQMETTLLIPLPSELDLEPLEPSRI